MKMKVCDMMCASVRQQMMLGVNDYLEVDRTQWMQNWPGQIVLNGSQVPNTFNLFVLLTGERKFRAYMGTEPQGLLSRSLIMKPELRPSPPT